MLAYNDRLKIELCLNNVTDTIKVLTDVFMEKAQRISVTTHSIHNSAIRI